jgi:hypothetical protein
MEIDLGEVRRHYRSLSDEALLEIEPVELTEEARSCVDSELAERGLARPVVPVEPAAMPTRRPMREWRGEGCCIHAVESTPSREDSSSLDWARAVLETAGIPCRVESRAKDACWKGPRPAFDVELMVPVELWYEAHSLRDVHVFNPEEERQWRGIFEELSDADLRAIRIEELVAGWLDRAARMRRAYENEIARRGRSRE